MTVAPFSMNRRIAWGECDPARIYYTPRVVDYALEAVETWLERDMGFSWATLYRGLGCDISPGGIECTYMRPMVAGQNARLRLWPVRATMTGLTLRVVGEDEEGTACFRVELSICFVDRKRRCAVPVPAELRAVIESRRIMIGPAPDPNSEKDERSGAALCRVPAEGKPPAEETHSCAEGAIPFTRQRRVSMGDASSGGFIRPSRVFEYAVEAVGEWYEAVVGVSWMDLVCRREYGAPFVSAACDFLGPLRPGDRVTLGVRVTRLGGASLGFAVNGFDERGEACFRSRLGACFIDRKTFRSMRIPDEFRGAIERYMQACSADAAGQGMLNPAPGGGSQMTGETS